MALVETLQEKTAALVAPIEGASPVGVDFTFEPDFEAVKKEVDKLSSVDDKPNWGAVATGSAAILKNKSKDFRIGVWNTIGLMQVNNFAGFAEGVVTLRGLVTQFWEPMFPDVKRGRARANMMTWLTEQAASFLEKVDVNERNGEAVKVSDDVLNEVDSALAEKLGDLYQGLGRLKAVMRDKVRQIPAPPPPPPPPTEGGSTSSTTTTTEAAVFVPETSGGTDVPVATGMGDADNALVFHGQAIAAVGHVLRRENAMEANAYRLLRVGIWLPMVGVPYADGNTTMIPPPPLDSVAAWDALGEAGSWAEMLEAVESEIPNYPFWLDLQRRSALALDKLGPEYKAARAALGRGVVTFITGLPGIHKLAFSDGTAFADSMTLEWLEGEQEKYGGGGGGPSKSALAVNVEEEELKKRMEEAKALVFGGNVPDGLSLATQLSMRAVDARTRFRSRISVAQMALDSGKRDIARAMLEALIVEADRHDLDTWEPALSVPLYANLLSCLRGGRGPDEMPAPETLAREAFLYDKLCRLDPAAALKLATAGGQGG